MIPDLVRYRLEVERDGKWIGAANGYNCFGSPEAAVAWIRNLTPGNYRVWDRVENVVVRRADGVR